MTQSHDIMTINVLTWIIDPFMIHPCYFLHPVQHLGRQPVSIISLLSQAIACHSRKKWAEPEEQYHSVHCPSHYFDYQSNHREVDLES